MSSTGIHFSISLPEELLFRIFALSIRGGYPQTMVGLLRLSKSIYYWVLPQLYHTLYLCGEGGEDPLNGSISRKRLIRKANPKNVSSFVRRLRCDSYIWSFSFEPFTSLTHLALWEIQDLSVKDAKTIVQLSLEELIIRHWSDRRAFGEAIRSNSPLCVSLRRYGSLDPHWSIEVSSWSYFPNLTHFLILHSETAELPLPYIHGLLDRGGLKCMLLVLPWALRDDDAFNMTKEALEAAQDRRIVVFQSCPRHLALYPDEEAEPPFWPRHEKMWRLAEEMIEANTDSEKITVGDYHE
ncbi:hypothetical protein DL96DRAFT_1824716 [Flagelloscypha sp. PMI_526]|nr:hypothetical protein DL96DRAFT_1824716 [Flagelloscypha sp. PMI_526]